MKAAPAHDGLVYNPLFMLHRLLLTIALIFLFGLGQQGALTHAVGHLADSQQNRPQDKSHHAPACDKCVVYAEISSAHGATIFALPRNNNTHVLHESPLARTDSIPHFSYAARAPPILA